MESADQMDLGGFGRFDGFSGLDGRGGFSGFFFLFLSSLCVVNLNYYIFFFIKSIWINHDSKYSQVPYNRGGGG